jgi:hypothetical protein
MKKPERDPWTPQDAEYRRTLILCGSMAASAAFGVVMPDASALIYSGFVASVQAAPFTETLDVARLYFDGALTEIALRGEGLKQVSLSLAGDIPEFAAASLDAMRVHLRMAKESVSTLIGVGGDLAFHAKEKALALLPEDPWAATVSAAKTVGQAIIVVTEAWGAWLGMKDIYERTMKKLGGKKSEAPEAAADVGAETPALAPADARTEPTATREASKQCLVQESVAIQPPQTRIGPSSESMALNLAVGGAATAKTFAMSSQIKVVLPQSVMSNLAARIGEMDGEGVPEDIDPSSAKGVFWMSSRLRSNLTASIDFGMTASERSALPADVLAMKIGVKKGSNELVILRPDMRSTHDESQGPLI